jgi:hypothetical protein
VFVTPDSVEPPVPLLKQTGRPPTRNSTAEIRYCKRHGRVAFHLYSAGKPRQRWRCKRCVGEAVTRRHQKIKRILVAEAGGGCAVCGYDRCVVNLHFHHVDPSKKSFGVTVARGKSLDAYRAEARKCVLVCANCHGEIEAGLIPSPPPQARYAAA